ncbi:hypothetical protein A3Q56_07555 [Intoshia linei]|uniref:Uncharacterized protein n=1 Tax=Intoshia linei TaxID=1819745 RepID=A0A177ARX8_9BILA|nr:hypothetical protein A3Q56_07555 [Intoshia linei]
MIILSWALLHKMNCIYYAHHNNINVVIGDVSIYRSKHYIKMYRHRHFKFELIGNYKYDIIKLGYIPEVHYTFYIKYKNKNRVITVMHFNSGQTLVFNSNINIIETLRVEMDPKYSNSIILYNNIMFIHIHETKIAIKKMPIKRIMWTSFDSNFVYLFSKNSIFICDLKNMKIKQVLSQVMSIVFYHALIAIKMNGEKYLLINLTKFRKIDAPIHSQPSQFHSHQVQIMDVMPIRNRIIIYTKEYEYEGFLKILKWLFKLEKKQFLKFYISNSSKLTYKKIISIPSMQEKKHDVIVLFRSVFENFSVGFIQINGLLYTSYDNGDTWNILKSELKSKLQIIFNTYKKLKISEIRLIKKRMSRSLMYFGGDKWYDVIGEDTYETRNIYNYNIDNKKENFVFLAIYTKYKLWLSYDGARSWSRIFKKNRFELINSRYYIHHYSKETFLNIVNLFSMIQFKIILNKLKKCTIDNRTTISILNNAYKIYDFQNNSNRNCFLNLDNLKMERIKQKCELKDYACSIYAERDRNTGKCFKVNTKWINFLFSKSDEIELYDFVFDSMFYKNKCHGNIIIQQNNNFIRVNITNNITHKSKLVFIFIVLPGNHPSSENQINYKTHSLSELTFSSKKLLTQNFNTF